MSADEESTPSEQPELASSALGGFLWLSAGNGVRAVLKIAFLALLGRLLTPTDFGVVAAAMVVVWLSMLGTNLGVGPALVQRPRLEPRHVSTGLVSSLTLGALIGAAVWFGAPALERAFRIEELAPVLRGLALLFPIGGVAVVAECLLQRRMHFRAIATAELVSYALGYGTVGIALAWLDYGPWALVGAEIAKQVVKSSILLAAVPESLRFRFERRAFAELFRFGSGYTLTSLTTYLAMQGDKMIAGRFLGAAALGHYTRAYELMLIPSQALGTVLDKVLFPTMSRLQGDLPRLRTAYRRGTALVALLVLPISGLTLVLAPEIVWLLLGPQWGSTVAPLRVLTAAMYFRVAYMVGQSVANATGAVHRASWRNAVYAVLVVAGSAVGLAWGLSGLAAGVAVAVGVNFLLVWHLATRLTTLPPREFLEMHVAPLRVALATAFAALAAALPLRAAGAPPPLILLAALAAAGGFALFLLRLSPARMLGPDGRWLAETLSRSAPAPLRPLLALVLSPAS